MKIVAKIIASALLALGASAYAQVSLQDFSSVYPNVNTVFYGTWAANGDTVSGDSTPASGLNQGTGVFNVTGSGVNNSSSSKLEMFNSSSVNIVGSSSYLALTAQLLSGNGAGAIVVTLVDPNNRIISASFDTALFSSSSYTTVYAPLSINALFNYGSVDSIQISGGVGTSPFAAFAVSFDNLTATAIPEPSTYAAIFGAASFGLTIFRRQKRRAALAA